MSHTFMLCTTAAATGAISGGEGDRRRDAPNSAMVILRRLLISAIVYVSHLYAVHDVVVPFSLYQTVHHQQIALRLCHCAVLRNATRASKPGPREVANLYGNKHATHQFVFYFTEILTQEGLKRSF